MFANPMWPQIFLSDLASVRNTSFSMSGRPFTVKKKKEKNTVCVKKTPTKNKVLFVIKDDASREAQAISSLNAGSDIR